MGRTPGGVDGWLDVRRSPNTPFAMHLRHGGPVQPQELARASVGCVALNFRPKSPLRKEESEIPHETIMHCLSAHLLYPYVLSIPFQVETSLVRGEGPSVPPRSRSTLLLRWGPSCSIHRTLQYGVTCVQRFFKPYLASSGYLQRQALISSILILRYITFDRSIDLLDCRKRRQGAVGYGSRPGAPRLS